MPEGFDRIQMTGRVPENIVENPHRVVRADPDQRGGGDPGFEAGFERRKKEPQEGEPEEAGAPAEPAAEPPDSLEEIRDDVILSQSALAMMVPAAPGAAGAAEAEAEVTKTAAREADAKKVAADEASSGEPAAALPSSGRHIQITA